MSETVPQISFTEHKKHFREHNRKRTHHQTKKRRSSRFDERWKRSGAMTGHHGCDEHYKNRTCPGCQGDEDHRCGSSCGWMNGLFWREKYAKSLSYVARKEEEGKIRYVDKDLGILYYEKPIPAMNVGIGKPDTERYYIFW